MGELLTTTGDMITFLKALNEGKLVTKQSWQPCRPGVMAIFQAPQGCNTAMGCGTFNYGPWKARIGL